MRRRYLALVPFVGVAAAPVVLRPGPPAPPPALAGALIGHRGGLSDAPENSLEAIRSAAAAGADGVELDIRLRGDAAVCAHDADQVDGAPTLAAALDEALALGLLVELDVKETGVVPILAAEIDARDAYDRVWVSAFHPWTAWRLRRLEPRIALGWPMTSTGWSAVDALLAWDGPARWMGASVLEPHVDLADEQRLRRWQQRGWTIEVWTVEGPADAAALRAQGIAVVADSVR